MEMKNRLLRKAVDDASEWDRTDALAAAVYATINIIDDYEGDEWREELFTVIGDCLIGYEDEADG